MCIILTEVELLFLVIDDLFFHFSHFLSLPFSNFLVLQGIGNICILKFLSNFFAFSPHFHSVKESSFLSILQGGCPHKDC
mmetsp:Transcript_11106/g.11195  ORF Transcript_11106/g.11195 Transcript_11106/m.11195 type:complete len:80 (-) Transcript_11106:473-712(-)